MLFVDLLEPQQWKYAAVAAAVLCTASFYYCLRHPWALACGVAPAFLLSGPFAGLSGRNMTVAENFYALAFIFSSFAVLFIILRPETRRAHEKEAAGEEYVVPKWKVHAWGVAVTVLMFVFCFPLDAATD